MEFHNFYIDWFLILFTAHLIADFILQPEWLVALKKHEHGNILHAFIHAFVTWLLLWRWRIDGIVIAVFISHLIIDHQKVRMLKKHNNIWIFLGDQLLHVLTLGLILWISLSVLRYSRWGLLLCYPLECSDIKLAGLIVIDLFIISTSFAGHIIGFVTKNIITENKLKIAGLKNGGKLIGNLERALIFFLVLFNMPSVIGLIAAAKSILRFGEIKKDWKIAEYVLIGTLMSFLIAIVLGYIARFVVIRNIPDILN